MSLAEIQFSYPASVAMPDHFDGWRTMRVALSRRLTYFMREFSEQVKITFSNMTNGAGEFQCTLKNVINVERVYPDDMPFSWTIGIEMGRQKNSHRPPSPIFISFKQQSYFDVAKKCILLHFQMFPNAADDRNQDSPRSSVSSASTSSDIDAPCSLLEFLGVPTPLQRTTTPSSLLASGDSEPEDNRPLSESVIRVANVRWKRPRAWFSRKMQLAVSESFLVFRRWKSHKRGEIANILSLYAITSLQQEYCRGKPGLRVGLYNGDTHRIAFHTVDDMYHWLCDFRTVLKHDPDDHIDEQKLEWDLELPAEDDPIYGIWMKLRGTRTFAEPVGQRVKVANYEDEKRAIGLFRRW
ncbi:hypothetical protein DL96DRAFT_1811175 [Flagelloscypha sp. PMI_526]|nr:hypothetical protein DL96DRAFT_1811175 [Flagelloscypha sp. PMI_526]